MARWPTFALGFGVWYGGETSKQEGGGELDNLAAIATLHPHWFPTPLTSNQTPISPAFASCDLPKTSLHASSAPTAAPLDSFGGV
jgi:hypothetical protein